MHTMEAKSCESPDSSEGDHVGAEDVADHLQKFLRFFLKDRDNHPVIQDLDATTVPGDLRALLCFW